MAVLAAAAVGQRILPAPHPSPNAEAVLPPGSAYSQAKELYRKAFPQLAAESTLAVIAQRAAGISAADLQALAQLAVDIRQATGAPALSPASPLLHRRLLSPDGQAAMLVVNLPTSFVSPRTLAATERVLELAHANAPPGLRIEVTGTAAMGRDYVRASQTGAHRTTWVTISAVLIILIAVYRSPVGAFVPLISIGASAYLAYVALQISRLLGWQFGAIEWVFCVVLIFGAGTDYALFWTRATVKRSLPRLTSASRRKPLCRPRDRPS
jgi:RND superfamily putative drug exporter